jgi:hypothetical protein
MCCKVYDIPELSKHAGTWCTHRKPGRGCTIHDHLPRQCAEFYCMWRYDEELPPSWKPDKSKMVVTVEPTSKYIIVQVDPNAPTAWRNQPYYDDLRLWAARNLHTGQYVLVAINHDATLALKNCRLDQ